MSMIRRPAIFGRHYKFHSRKRTSRGVPAAAVAMILACATATAADATREYHFNLSSQTLSQALRAYGQISGQEIIFTEDVVAGLTAAPLQGEFTAQDALSQLLRGTGLIFERSPSGALMIRRFTARTSMNRSAESALRLGQAESPESTSRLDAAALEEVVVLGAKRKFAPTDSTAATKIPMDVFDTPQSMTIISRDMMDVAAVADINDVAALAPSTLQLERDISVVSGLVSRGFPVNSRFGYKIDGVPIINDSFLLDLDLAERVDIVRGPSSIVYGQSDYGSTLNVELKKPKAKRGVIAELSAGSYDRWGALLDLTGHLSSDGRLRGRVIGSIKEAQSAQDFASQETTTFASSLAYDITSNTTVEVSGFTARSDINFSEGFGLTTAGELPNLPKSVFLGADWNSSEIYTDFIKANLEHRVGRTTLSVAISHSEHGAPLNEVIPLDAIPSDGQVPFAHFYRDLDHVSDAVSATVSSSFDALGRSHEYMFDVLYRTDAQDLVCCQFVPIGTIDVYSIDPTAIERLPIQSDIALNQQDDVDLSLGGLVLFHPTERLTLMAGLRWQQFENKPKGANGWFGNAVPFTDKAVVPRLGVVYELSSNINLYASYSEGSLFRTAIRQDGSSLGPEEGVQWEAGAKARWLEGRLNMALSLFTIDRNNVVAADPQFPQAPWSIGLDGQTHRGIEYEMIGEPIPGWNILFNYSYLEVDVTDAPFPEMIGQQRANSPHHQGKLYSTYQFLGGALKGLSIGGGVAAIGEREVDNFGTLRLPSYLRVDARIAYERSDNISFSVNFLNLTDEDIYVSALEASGFGINFIDHRAVVGKVTVRY